ncbi:MAG: hypothetical protein QF473_26130, partial [Planctomycetota bacterium]|nr:hypothetical protein [Planctomycetota bacterium]
SQDGATWSEPRRSDPSKRKIRLSASSQAKGRSRTAFWIRLLLRGNAGVPSNRAAALNALEISASFEPPL